MRFLEECRENEVDADQDYPDPDDDVEGVSAEFGDLADLLTKRAADRTENEQRDTQTYCIDEDGEKTLEGGLVEGDVGENDEEHGCAPADSYCSKRKAEKECPDEGISIWETEPVENAPNGRFV